MPMPMPRCPCPCMTRTNTAACLPVCTATRVCARTTRLHMARRSMMHGVARRRGSLLLNLRGKGGQLLFAQFSLVVEAGLDGGMDGGFKRVDVRLHDGHTERLANLGSPC